MIKNVSRFLAFLLAAGVAVSSTNSFLACDCEYVRCIFDKSDCFIEERKISVEGIVIHSTACPGVEPQGWKERWNKSGVPKGVHFFMGRHDMVQTLASDQRGWHCGGSCNNNCIGIEMCEPKSIVYNSDKTEIIKDKSDFTSEEAKEDFKRRWDNMVLLTATLCKIYKLDPEKDVISHAEGGKRGITSRHLDPEHWWIHWGKNMDDFRKCVAKLMKDESNKLDELGEKIKETDKVCEKIKESIKASELNKKINEPEKLCEKTNDSNEVSALHKKVSEAEKLCEKTNDSNEVSALHKKVNEPEKLCEKTNKSKKADESCKKCRS